MPADRNDESGQFTEQYPQDAFVAAVEEAENATTQKVADEVGCSYDLAYRRLNELYEEGGVERTKIGSSFVWSR